jgi:hypothetical protein
MAQGLRLPLLGRCEGRSRRDRRRGALTGQAEIDRHQLINGKWQAADIDYEHEEIGEVAGGFSGEEGAHVDRRTTDVLR